ncbi:subtilisin-like protein [Epithele typhae]|uniref:subtilisin-like protein n=1 Tax=Epithele typhae TaxID=378194 RepID=UPI002008E117|nr:subtilisin-like protein [Epithele typhae]KAH9942399.1 subtilisin-like protein [Epithele typhae]
MLVSSFWLFIGLTTSLVSPVAAFTPLQRRVQHEPPSSLPHGWTLHRRADPDTRIPLSIALRQENIDQLESFLLAIADPSSPSYGQHWSVADVAAAFRPSDAAFTAVRAWLASEGVAAARVRGGTVEADVSVAEAERLLAARYFVYRHDGSGAESVAAHHGYLLPEDVAAHVDVVSPTVNVVEPRAQLEEAGAAVRRRDGGMDGMGPVRSPMRKLGHTSSSNSTDGCDELVTLDCLRKLYDFEYEFQAPLETVGSGASHLNAVGVVELTTQTYTPKDLDIFFKKYAPDVVGQRPVLNSINGGKINASETNINLIGESNLDFELIMGLIGGNQSTQLYQVGGGGSWEEMLNGWDTTYCSNSSSKFDNCGSAPLSYVVSVSYAGPELGNSRTLQRQCDEFGKLSLMGATFLFASGDSGVASNVQNYCKTDSSFGYAVGKGNFLPNFPQTCPYITAVGATQVPAGKSASDPERAVYLASNDFTSGGGFSNVFPRPRWQHRAVGGYLAKHAPAYGAGVYNRSGRAIPDLSANGWPIAAVDDGDDQRFYGTSASTPIVGAMVAAINDARRAAGKGPVGWINPAIYSNLFADAFHDITEGFNSGCERDRAFNATHGWDPVTGLGTINFPRLLARFMLLP